MTRITKKDLREHQIWDDLSTGGVNECQRIIRVLGTTHLTYETETGVQRTVKISSFVTWANRYAECTASVKPKSIPKWAGSIGG